MIIAADYPLANVIWTMFVFFALVIWIWMLFAIFTDLFSRHDASGWVKAGWTILVIFLPLIGVLAYLIVNGKDMAERRAKDVEASQAAVDAHIRSVAGGGQAAEISQAKQLLDSGAITQAEFEQLKARALASNGGTTPVAAG